jgi:hypothetical protein
MNQEKSKKPLLQKIPWWFHLLFAIFSYCTLGYLLPSLGAPENVVGKLFRMAPQAAPIVAVAFLLLAANALYKDDPPKDISKEDVDHSGDET